MSTKKVVGALTVVGIVIAVLAAIHYFGPAELKKHTGTV